MYQKIIIAGNLGRDPEMRFMPSGKAVTNLVVATNHQYTASDGERIKETTWFRVSVWGKQAESVNDFLRKGSKVLVEGRLTSDSETGGPKIYKKSDGSYGASFEINASRVVFLTTQAEAKPEIKEQEEELPF
jgi:single-strand DNA-binding protein